jgi:hypothetical protein
MTPEALCNRALDAVGCSDQVIGDIQSGTKAAQVCLRHYIPCLEQLLRAAHWNYARKQAPMQLLAAAPGFGPSVPQGDTPQIGHMVIPPWTYEYAFPIDCIQARFVPHNRSHPLGETPSDNISVAPGRQTTFDTPVRSGYSLEPARMLVASDNNYPLPIASDTPPQQWWNVRGVSPDIRTVVLCDVPHAELVYTAFIPYPNLWDPLFQSAFVALLATHLAIPCNPDRKEGRALRGEQVALAKAAIGQARVSDGNEGTNYVGRQAEWIRGRNIGVGFGGFGGFEEGGVGVLGYGWGSVVFGDGSAAY